MCRVIYQTSMHDINVVFKFFFLQVKRVVVYLGRDKTMQLLEELMTELELTDAVSSAVTHMDNPPYYRITSSYKIPSVTGQHQTVQSDVDISPSLSTEFA